MAMVARGASPDTESNNTFGYTPGIDDDSRLKMTPMRRDTWLLAPSAYTVFRFKANNPGVWLLHCHMEWHVEAGLTATIIEAPQQLQDRQHYIPPAMAAICKSQGIPTFGNAAGNSKNYTDLRGENVVATMGRGSLYP
jgi:iron transport multicopper oxidase